MKREMHPLILAGIAVVAVLLLGWFGYRALQPAPYTPSPGVPGNPRDDPWLKSHPVLSGQPSGTTADGKAYYPSAPAGSMPGRPVNSSH